MQSLNDSTLLSTPRRGWRFILCRLAVLRLQRQRLCGTDMDSIQVVRLAGGRSGDTAATAAAAAVAAAAAAGVAAVAVAVEAAGSSRVPTASVAAHGLRLRRRLRGARGA